MTKYKAVGRAVDEVMELLCGLCVYGANVAALCKRGDEELLTKLQGVFSKPQLPNPSVPQNNSKNHDSCKESVTKNKMQNAMYEQAVTPMLLEERARVQVRLHSMKRRESSLRNVSGNCIHGTKKVVLPRGISYPTNISVNDVLCNYAPYREEESYVLQVHDVVKIHIGGHLDGYPVSAARTIIVAPSLPLHETCINPDSSMTKKN
uniref:Proliferation-associated protein 2G4 n=1 Tax=Lygus hesperus TaxID=30085 RepID=A0A0A9WP93_LYGHE